MIQANNHSIILFDKTSYKKTGHRPFMGSESIATNKSLWYNAHYHNVVCGGVPFGDVPRRAKAHRMRKVLGDIVARALAYGKCVGFLSVRKIREPL